MATSKTADTAETPKENTPKAPKPIWNTQTHGQPNAEQAARYEVI